MEIVDVTLKQVFEAIDKLNNRPQKCLNLKTSYEVFENRTGIDIKKLTGYAIINNLNSGLDNIIKSFFCERECLIFPIWLFACDCIWFHINIYAKIIIS